MQKLNHPWRKGRSERFAAYLDTLTKAERQLIETAERAFIAKSESATSLQRCAIRDHAKSMLGVKEYEPAAPRGFVA